MLSPARAKPMSNSSSLTVDAARPAAAAAHPAVSDVRRSVSAAESSKAEAWRRMETVVPRSLEDMPTGGDEVGQLREMMEAIRMRQREHLEQWNQELRELLEAQDFELNELKNARSAKATNSRSPRSWARTVVEDGMHVLKVSRSCLDEHYLAPECARANLSVHDSNVLKHE